MHRHPSCRARSARYFYFITYFDVPASYLLALIIDWLDSRVRAAPAVAATRALG